MVKNSEHYTIKGKYSFIPYDKELLPLYQLPFKNNKEAIEFAKKMKEDWKAKSITIYKTIDIV